MSDLVLDASLALQWFLVDEADRKYSLSVLSSLSEKQAVVPVLWFYEVGNGLLMAYRRKRIAQDQIDGFLTRLKNSQLKPPPKRPLKSLTCPPSPKLTVLRTMTLPIFHSHYVSDCPSQQTMPLCAGPPWQQPCKSSSLFLYCRLVCRVRGHPSWNNCDPRSVLTVACILRRSFYELEKISPPVPACPFDLFQHFCRRAIQPQPRLVGQVGADPTTQRAFLCVFGIPDGFAGRPFCAVLASRSSLPGSSVFLFSVLRSPISNFEFLISISWEVDRMPVLS